MWRSVLVILGLGASACTPESAEAPASPALSGANPASVHCVQMGGRVVIRDEPDGQVGDCHLPDGRVVEEWALWRQANGS